MLLAPHDRKSLQTAWRKKSGKFIFHEKLLLRALELGHNATSPYSIQTEHFCKQLSVNPRTVSYSEMEGEWKKGGEGEGESEHWGSDWRKRGVLVHNYSRDLWPEKQFINHSAWANVLQIVLHAAAILVCVKRHNKPGWRTCLGGDGGGGTRRKVEIVGGGWGRRLTKFLRCFEQRNWVCVYIHVSDSAEVQSVIFNITQGNDIINKLHKYCDTKVIMKRLSIWTAKAVNDHLYKFTPRNNLSFQH